MRAHFNIGSNLGDRRENLQQAVAALRRLALSHNNDPQLRVSDIIESQPWGYNSPLTYLNLAVSFETPLTPEALLTATQAIERTLGSHTHRNPDGTYADRLIDIDLIFLGDLHIDHPAITAPLTTSTVSGSPDTTTASGTLSIPAVTLPHPRWQDRQFVILPLLQIDPDLYALHTNRSKKVEKHSS